MKGLSSIIIILILITLASIGGTYYLTKEKSTTTTTTTSTTITTSVTTTSTSTVQTTTTTIISVLSEGEYQNIWKKLLLTCNGISETYFSNHIFIKQAYTYGPWFLVKYDYSVDWATDEFPVDEILIKNGTKFLTKEEILIKPGICKIDKPKNFRRISVIKEINQIISKAEASDILKTKCHSLMEFYPQAKPLQFNNFFIGLINGTLSAYREVYVAENDKCMEGAVNLETGEIMYCRDSDCAWYD